MQSTAFSTQAALRPSARGVQSRGPVRCVASAETRRLSAAAAGVAHLALASSAVAAVRSGFPLLASTHANAQDALAAAATPEEGYSFSFPLLFVGMYAYSVFWGWREDKERNAKAAALRARYPPHPDPATSPTPTPSSSAEDWTARWAEASALAKAKR